MRRMDDKERCRKECDHGVAEQKRQGAAVILASTEPELVLAHADRIVTLARGRITRIFTNERATKQDLMRFAEV